MSNNIEQVKEKPIDVDELHSVLGDFLETLEKFKLSKRLGTYHQYYMWKAKERTKVVKENDLAKVQQLIPPGIGTDHNFDIYSFFIQKCRTSSISIPIIDSLIISQDHKGLAFITNDSNGKLNIIRGIDALDQFCTKLNSFNALGYPVCIFKPKSGKNVLFNNTNNIRVFINETDNISGLFQRYVIPQNDRKFFFRAHWKCNSKISGYLVGSTNFQKKYKVLLKPLPNLHLPYSKSNECLELCKKKYKNGSKMLEIGRNHSIASNCSSKNILRSFDESESEIKGLLEAGFMNNTIASIKDELEQKFSLATNEDKLLKELTMDERFANKFIVTGRNPENSFATKVKYVFPEIEEITKNVVSIIHAHSIKNKIKLEEITIDFIKNVSGSWLVLKVDKILINEDKSKFQELILPDNMRIHNTFIPLLLHSDAPSKPESLCISPNLTEPEIINQRVILKDESRPRRVTLKDASVGPVSQTVEEKYDNIIQRLEKLSMTTLPKIPNILPEIISNYEKNYNKSELKLHNKKKELAKKLKPINWAP